MDDKTNPGFRINVKKMTLFPLIEDSEGQETTYSEKPDTIPGTMQLTIKPNLTSGKLYGDGHVRDEQNVVMSLDIDVEHNKWPLSLVAKYSGSDIIKHGVRTNVSDQPINFAMGYCVELTGGGEELTWLYKCKIAPSDKNAQQRTESINYSTDRWIIKALPLEYNGDIKFTVDTSDPEMGFTTEMAKTWLDEVHVLPPKGEETDPPERYATGQTSGQTSDNAKIDE